MRLVLSLILLSKSGIAAHHERVHLGAELLVALSASGIHEGRHHEAGHAHAAHHGERVGSRHLVGRGVAALSQSLLVLKSNLLSENSLIMLRHLLMIGHELVSLHHSLLVVLLHSGGVSLAFHNLLLLGESLSGDNRSLGHTERHLRAHHGVERVGLLRDSLLLLLLLFGLLLRSSLLGGGLLLFLLLLGFLGEALLLLLLGFFLFLLAHLSKLSLLTFLALLLFLLALSSLLGLALLRRGNLLGFLEKLRVGLLAVLGGIISLLIVGSGLNFLFIILLIIFLVILTVVLLVPLLFTFSALLGLTLFSNNSSGLLGNLLGLLFDGFGRLGSVLRTIDLLTLGLSVLLTLNILTVLLLFSSLLLGLLGTLLLLLLSLLGTLRLLLNLFGFSGNSSLFGLYFAALALDGIFLPPLLLLCLLNTSRHLVLPGHGVVPGEVLLGLSQRVDPLFELGGIIADVDASATDLVSAHKSLKLVTVLDDGISDELLLLFGELVLILVALLRLSLLAAIVPLATSASPAAISAALALAAAISTSALTARRTTVATGTASTTTALIATATSRAHLLVGVLVTFDAFLNLSRLVISTTRTTAIVDAFFTFLFVVSVATAAATVLTSSSVVVATSTRRVALGSLLSLATAFALGSIVLLVRSPLVGVVGRALVATLQFGNFGSNIFLLLVDV